ncbi:MAG: histidinol-phosphatase [Spirochaetales bacterium]|nr:histidinol-phosphatase [Spirochaetales bacterium]
MLYNLHTHSNLSDGRNSLEQIVETAANENIEILGISDHSTVPFPTEWNMKDENVEVYLKEIERLREIYPSVKILAGIEGDFIPGVQNFSQMSDFEYIIGSVHYALTDGEPESFDSSPDAFDKIVKNFYNNDVQKFIKYYYDALLQMVDSCRFDIVGHLDLVKKFNTVRPSFDEQAKAYKSKVYEVLELIKECSLTVELNTGGITRNLMKDPYPSFDFIKLARQMDIPICINSDSHAANTLLKNREIAVEAALSAGYKYEYIPVIDKFQDLK